MQINGINYERLRGLGIEPTDPESNIVAGVFMIGELPDKYGDTNKALNALSSNDFTFRMPKSTYYEKEKTKKDARTRRKGGS